MAFFSIFMLSMLGSLLLIPPLMKLAVRLDFVDTPDERKVHTGQIPRIGGVAMVIGTLVAVLFLLKIDQQILAFILAIVCLTLFGLWDDRMQLGYRIKFIGQLLASVIVIFYADVKIDSMPFLYDGIIPDIFAIPFTFFVLLGAMNAINLSDGLDGLAGGGALLSLGVIAVLGFQAGDIEFVMITLAVMGSVFGFLRFNTHPAVVFMGDTGSQFLGFSIGVLAILLIQEVNPVLSPSIGMVILGLPILDTFSVICLRIANGQSAFRADQNHIHHKLLKIGLDHYEVVFIIYLIQSAMVICAYYFRYYEGYTILFYYVLFGVVINVLLARIKPGQLRSSNSQGHSTLKQLLGVGGGKRAKLVLLITAIVLILMPTFFVWVSLTVGTISMDVGLVAAIIFSLVVAGLLLWGTRFSEQSLRIGLYLISTLCIYLIYQDPGFFTKHQHNLNIIFFVMAVFVIIGLMMPDKGKISITPLDYIIIFVVISMTWFTSSLDKEITNYTTLFAWLFVLFYATEYLLMSIRQHQYLIKMMLLLSLAVLGVQAIV